MVAPRMIRPVALAIVVLALGGGAAFWYARSTRGPAPPVQPVAASSPAPTRVKPPIAPAGLIGGVGASSDQEDAGALRKRLDGHLPALVELRDEVDVSNHYRCSEERFAFVLAKPAHVTLTLRTPDPHVVLDSDLADGSHRVDLSLGHAPFGDFDYELAALATDGTQQTHSAKLRHTMLRSDPWQLAHTLVKDVDLHDGHLALYVPDVKLDGREPLASFTRMYSSNGGNETGVLGRGWRTTADTHVRSDACGQTVFIGSTGQSQRFARTTNADGGSEFRVQYGYHTVLVATADGYDLYGKDGTRNHYAEHIGDSWYLSYTEATNGERLVHTYADIDGERHVTSIKDGSGRELKLGYTRVAAHDEASGDTDAVRLTSLDGPLGLHVDYAYDPQGDLQRVRIADASALGENITEYGYEDFSPATWPDAGITRAQHIGRKLVRVRDAIADGLRTFRYETGAVAVRGGEVMLRHVQARVVAVVEPDEGQTRIKYSGTAGEGAVTTTVTLNGETTYEMDDFGLASSMRSAAGTTRWERDMSTYQPSRTIDGDGFVTEDTYDAHGNRTRQVITHPDGDSIQRQWTFAPAANFARPFIRDHQATYTDGRGLETRYEYDKQARLIKLSRGDFTEQRRYAENGDLLERHNSDRESWQYEYDAWGHQIGSKDADGVTKRSEYDARDRQITDINAAGLRSESRFDVRDREISRSPSADPASEDPVAIVYDDRLRTETRTDRHGKKIIISHDAMWRRTKIVDGDGRVWSARYDYAGNKLQEISFARAITNFDFDRDNRLTKKTEPDGTIIEYTYDATDHVVSELTRHADGERQLIENRYEHPLHKLTQQRVRKGDSKPETWRQAFDGNGNRVRLQRPDGEITEFRFDAFDRQIDASRQTSL